MTDITGELIKTPYHLYEATDTVLVKNPFEYEWRFRVQGIDYILPGGEKTELLGYMANVYLKGVVDEMMQKDEKILHITNQAERQKYVDKVVLDYRPALAPVGAQKANEPIVLSSPKTGELAGAVSGGDHELPVATTDATTLDADQLEKLHPMDDGKGNKVPQDEEEFPGLNNKSRNDLMKDARDLGIEVKSTDTKESLMEKIRIAQS